MSQNPQQIISSIAAKAQKLDRPVKLMELCGTHSQSIAIHGLKKLLPANVSLVTGPGCPVCVTDQSDIDVMVELALNDVPVAIYGDTLRVPGNVMSLEEARRRGADVNIVYDTTQALELSKSKPRLVFFGLGFETTTPMTAWAIKKGLTVYSAHKLFPPAMAALLANKDNRLDGFIDPGHVSAIIGTAVYSQFKVPQVIAGFSAVDVLKAIDMLLSQILAKEPRVENEYTRVVRAEGNKRARDISDEVFQVTDARWRGLGLIPGSGLEIRPAFKDRDASQIYKKIVSEVRHRPAKPTACKCGLVLQGLIEPTDCALFGKACNPDQPYGACMVSVEGACNIRFRFNQ
ncbi:hydrogenase formation protein HypD [Candidatus Falkowbacteria bacterium]|nr:hydrogenase formation protein HypD [Candidatus Falkowbacteria bacterium]